MTHTTCMKKKSCKLQDYETIFAKLWYLTIQVSLQSIFLHFVTQLTQSNHWHNIGYAWIQLLNQCTAYVKPLTVVRCVGLQVGRDEPG
jgi:hypothetical protein